MSLTRLLTVHEDVGQRPLMLGVPSRPDLADFEGFSSSTTPSWSRADALLTVLAAVGALSLLQILLFGLHLPSPRSSPLGATVWTVGASAIVLGAAVAGARRFGDSGGVTAIGIRWPTAIDLAVGIPVGIALFFGTMWLQDFLNDHVSSWVSWYGTQEGLEPLTHGPWVVAGVVQLVVVPIGEESLFRGILYGGLRTRYSIAPAVVISAALFAFVHVNPVIMPGIFIDGVALALAFEWRRTLAMPMVIHGAVLACFLVQSLLR
ncbi:MAG TPA: CPBP family intramembrane glutamic endopeptidase [Actinomycetota bacterium]|nr:CPBP family intramembrane glutamic endopeptidase [Actinomycetota bacterium]